MLCDSQFLLEGFSAYSWVSIYICTVSFEMTFGKRLISKVTFSDPVWSSVLYTNLLALPVLLTMAAASGELLQVTSIAVTFRGTLAFLVGIVGGIGISWAGWNCR